MFYFSLLAFVTCFIALPCEICEELCPSDKLIDHQLQCRKERENGKRRELKDTSFEAQEFAFNECSTVAVHGVRKFSEDTVQL